MPSFSEVSSNDAESMDCEDVAYGFLEICSCGGALALDNECTPTGKYAGRLFYRCSNSEDGGYHTHKWWDKAVVEEIRRLRSLNSAMEARIRGMTLTEDGNLISPVALSRRIDHLERDRITLVENGVDNKQGIISRQPAQDRFTTQVRGNREVTVLAFCLALSFFVNALALLR